MFLTGPSPSHILIFLFSHNVITFTAENAEDGWLLFKNATAVHGMQGPLEKQGLSLYPTPHVSICLSLPVDYAILTSVLYRPHHSYVREKKMKTLRQSAVSGLCAALFLFFSPAVLLAGTVATPAAAATADVQRITKEEAKVLLGAPKVVFVDARTELTWSRSDRKIRGAVRIDKWDLEMWASPYPADTTFIIY
jgi:hypothetical protein